MSVHRVVASLLLAVALVAASGVGVGLPAPAPAATTTTPGTELAGALGAQGADLEGEVETRALDVSLRRAGTDTGRAAVVDERVSDIRERLAAIEDRRATLRARRADGAISDREFRVRMRALDARERALARLLNRSAVASTDLPAALRQRYNLTARLDALRANVTFDDATAAAVASEITLANGSIDLAATRLAYAEDRYEESGSSDEEVRAALACARDEIEAARAALADATAAARAGDHERAREHLDAVDRHLTEARACIERALETMNEDGSSYEGSSYDKSSSDGESSDGTYDWNKSTWDTETSDSSLF